jgi:ketosteroid isomerase-like protein
VSQENVELVRRYFAWLHELPGRDPANDHILLDRAFRDYLDPEVEVRLLYYPETSVYEGREGIRRYIARIRDSWSQWRFDPPERLVDAGDRVVVFLRVAGQGSTSGVPVEVKIAVVVTARDGRITSFWGYADRSEALKAVGLEE